MVTLNDLLSTYYEHNQQRTIETNAQLDQLRQHLVTGRLRIQQAESRLLQAQQQCLDQMRPFFATDARVLLKTSQFAAFVELLLEHPAGVAMRPDPPLRVAPSPTFWLLNSVPIALRLHEIELIELDNPDGTDGGVAVLRLQVALSDWRQPVHVSTHALRQQCQVMASIEDIRSQLPRSTSDCEQSVRLSHVVEQELACVVLYVARLFSLDSVTMLGTGFEL